MDTTSSLAPPLLPSSTARGHRLNIISAINQGDRDYQQDQIDVIPHHRTNGCMAAILADGMGGKSGGRKASEQVIMTSRQIFDRFIVGRDSAENILKQMVTESHLMIRLTAITSEEEPHSTFAGFIIEPNLKCSIGHAGDSRVYHIRATEILSTTKDHSYVQHLIDEGSLSPEQAMRHPQGNLLVGCLGSAQDPPQTTRQVQLEIGDWVMVCSDGLWHYFKNDEFVRVFAALDPKAAAELLTGKARSRAAGKGDNLSLILVRVDAL